MDAVLDPLERLLAEDDKVEWAGGTIVRHPPETFEENRLEGFCSTILATFTARRAPGHVFGSCFLQRLDASTVLAPDVSYLRHAHSDRIRPTHLEGGADLVVEIVSPTSRGRDRFDKRHDYERAGIEEYWVIDPERREGEFYRLRDGAYESVPPDAEGRAFSSAVPGFFVRVPWLWQRPDLFDAYRELGVF